MVTRHEDITGVEHLLLHVDGGCEPNPGGVVTSGWVLYDAKDPKKPLAEEAKVVLTGGDHATNNYGEYAALELGLEFLLESDWQGTLTVRTDSKLLSEQVKGAWKCNFAHLRSKRDNIHSQMNRLSLKIITADDPTCDGEHPCYIEWVRRHLNEHADSLCRKARESHLLSA